MKIEEIHNFPGPEFACPETVDPLRWAAFGSWAHWWELAQVEEYTNQATWGFTYCPLCDYCFRKMFDHKYLGRSPDERCDLFCIIKCRTGLWWDFANNPSQANAAAVRDDIAAAAMKHFGDDGRRKGEI